MTTAAGVMGGEDVAVWLIGEEDERLELEQTILAAFLTDAPGTLRATRAGRDIQPRDLKCAGHRQVLSAILEACGRWEQPTRESIEAALRSVGVTEAIESLRCVPLTATPEAAGDALQAVLDAFGAEPAQRGPQLLTGADIFETLPPVKWAIEALDVAPGAPLLIAGYGFSGKTLAAQDLALSWATGTPAWDRFDVTQGRVLHLDYEQGAYLTRLRYQRLARARGIDPSDLEDRLTVAPMPAWYLDGDSTDDLSRVCDGFDRLIVDSFRAACPRTDENSSEARVPLDRLTRVSEQTGITPVVIHHARKPSQNAQGGSRMAIRGSGALYDACGSVLVFGGEKGEPISVSHEKARITGRTHPDFQLWIEDVQIGRDATAGVRVKYLDAPSTETKQETPADRFAETKRRVLEVVKAEGTIAGVKALRARVGQRQCDVTAAVEELMHDGLIRKGGNYHQPTLEYAGNDRD